MPDADAVFETLAGSALEEILSRQPQLASALGDHRFDDRLSDLRPEALEDDRRTWRRLLGQLDKIDASALGPDNAVDAAILRNELDAHLFELEDLREHEWNPLISNPGEAVYVLLAREYGPLTERLEALAGRLAAIPESLAVARRSLGPMPRLHVETALIQFRGTLALVTAEVDAALERAPEATAWIEKVRPAAVAALQEHHRWLSDRLDDADRDPRIGPELFQRRLGLTLDTHITAEAIRVRALSNLDRIEETLAQTAPQLGSGLSVRDAYDRLAADRPDDNTVVGMISAALTEATRFVDDHALVTLVDDPLEIIVMPEVRRGVAVAYCDSPGSLEQSTLPTFFAVSPTPSNWSADRVHSFYSEYNAHMLHELVVHEAMPGHYLQLAHGHRAHPPTKVRAAFGSGTFIEGWAVYAEALMAREGYGGPAVKMQQLKMALRTNINALLDQGVHSQGMTEAEAMELMTGRGYQQEAEAAGKWRRAVLTSTQLSTYFVGHAEVSDAISALGDARPGHGERRVHDEFLSHGSPPPRHARALVGLPPSA